MHTTDPASVLLTVEEAARRLHLSRTTMFRLIKEGAVISVRIGRARRIPADALRDYVARLSRHAQPAS